jgi:hypothetical protein
MYKSTICKIKKKVDHSVIVKRKKKKNYTYLVNGVCNHSFSSFFTFWKESIISQATNQHDSELFVDCKHRSTSNSFSLFTCVDLSFPFLSFPFLLRSAMEPNGGYIRTHHHVNPSWIVFSLQSTVARNGMCSKNVEIWPRTNQLNLNGLLFMTARSSRKWGMRLL